MNTLSRARNAPSRTPLAGLVEVDETEIPFRRGPRLIRALAGSRLTSLCGMLDVTGWPRDLRRRDQGRSTKSGRGAERHN